MRNFQIFDFSNNNILISKKRVAKKFCVENNTFVAIDSIRLTNLYISQILFIIFDSLSKAIYKQLIVDVNRVICYFIKRKKLH